MQKGKISIAMATYNGERYLDEQLQSFTAQTRLPEELVVCDDCSNDSSVNILEEFALNAPFQVNIYLNKKKLGTGRNFAKALNLCNGDIVAFSDQDDVWMPYKLERIEQSFVSNPDISYVISDAEIVDENLNSLGYTLWKERKFSRHWQKYFNNKHELDVILRLTITTGMCTAIKLKLRKFGAPTPECITHDAWYIPLAAIFNERGALIKEPLAKYRQHNIQQYGAIKLPFGARIINAFSRNFDSINSDIKRMDSLRVYVENNYKSDLLESNVSIRKIIDKINHLRFRFNLIKYNRLARLPKIFNEMSFGNYRRFGSWKNIVIDTFLEQRRSTD